MDNMTSELVDGVPHTQEPEDGEVEDGEVEDDSLIDVGAMHETMRVKVCFHHDVFFALRLTESGRNTRSRGTLSASSSR